MVQALQPENYLTLRAGTEMLTPLYLQDIAGLLGGVTCSCLLMKFCFCIWALHSFPVHIAWNVINA
jgi:hypothetical protein